MIICHQCGHKIEIYSNITSIRCTKCRATYVSKPVKPIAQPVVEQARSPASIEKPANENFGGEDKTMAQGNPYERSSSEPGIKVGLRFWGTFDVEFLERVKSFTLPNSYQKEIARKVNQPINKLPLFYIPKNKVLIGRKPTNLAGFEDVDIKLETSDASISRRQCEIEITPARDKATINIQTHGNASNLVEVNGRIVEKSTKKMVFTGDFLRFGNTIFEVVIEKKEV